MILGLVAVAAGALLAAVPTPLAPGAANQTPREAFDRGRTAFGRAEYGRAIEILHPLIYPEVLLDTEGEIVQAHRMLGVAYLFANRPDDARREFRKLLELRPDYRFDPLLDPQRVVDFFNDVVKQEEATIAAIEARRRKRDQELAARRRDIVKLPPPAVLRYQRNSYLVNFLPFGAGQFQNGHDRKGWFFLATESALAAISVGAFATNLALFGLQPRRPCNIDPGGGLCPQDQIDQSDSDFSDLLLRVQVVSGGLFFATAIWGVVDAVRHYRRDVLLTGVAGGPDAGPRIVLNPHGLGAAWTF